MENRVHVHDNLIFTVGTKVVALRDVKVEGGKILHPRGSVGVVVRSPVDLDHSYRVRFPDGFEEALRREEVVQLAQFKEGQLSGGSAESTGNLLVDRLIFRCVTGSRAYGLASDDSDTDYRGVYLPTAEMHWSIYGVPEQIEIHETQEHYWELERFLVLALKANPNVLECLYTPIVVKTTPLGDELLELRSAFLSRLAYQTFNGYVMSQFTKMQADIRNHGAVKWKHVMHLLRLLITGIRILRDGFVPVRADEHREELLCIKRGEWPWEATERWRLDLHREFETAYQETTLPERPDYEKANDFLIKARRAAVANELP